MQGQTVKEILDEGEVVELFFYKFYFKKTETYFGCCNNTDIKDMLVRGHTVECGFGVTSEK